jgi:hypothetical protein
VLNGAILTTCRYVLARRLELPRQARIPLRSGLDRPTHPGILHFLGSFAFLKCHGAAGGRRGRKFAIGEIEWHARIVTPPGV